MGDSNFDSWRNSKHKFPDLPPNIKGHIRAQLQIPPGLETPIPNKRLSVLDFVATKIPPICAQTSSYIIPAGHSFFRTERHSEHFLSQMAAIMVPSRVIVVELMANATQQWLDGANSIQVPGNALFLPLWTLQVWVELHLTVAPAHDFWQKGIHWLKRDILGSFQDQIHSVYHSLSTLSWSGNILSALPGKTSFPKQLLASYLSRDWLTDEHVDQMTFLAEKEVNDVQVLSHPSHQLEIHFLDTIITRKLRQAYQLEIDGKENYDPFGTTFLPFFGRTLSMDSQLGGIFHVNDNHWIAIIIDIPAHDLLYGDPVGSAPNPDLVNALRWFLSKHIPFFPLDELDDGPLPCAIQNLDFDWFNCGILSYNALIHYFLPDQPLLQHTENSVFGDLARMSVLQKLIAFHNTVSLASSFSEVKFSYKI
jgi:hypothetical protein